MAQKTDPAEEVSANGITPRGQPLGLNINRFRNKIENP
jgi:hypothetical protein